MGRIKELYLEFLQHEGTRGAMEGNVKAIESPVFKKKTICGGETKVIGTA